MQNHRLTGEHILDSIVGNHMILDDDDRFGVVGGRCFNRPGNYLVNNESIWTTWYVAYVPVESIDPR